MMSEEKVTSVRFKEILKKAPVKHSTPVEVLPTLSRNMLSLNSSAFLSPVPKKSFEFTQPFEDGPQLTKAQNSWGLLQRKLSIGSAWDPDTTNSFQFMFPRRQLSTITGSDESSEASRQADVPSVTTSKRTRDSSELPTAIIGSEESCEAPGQMVFPSKTPRKRIRESSELPSKNWEVATHWASALKKSAAKKKKKADKKLVEKRVRAWVLRQLQNIEEATTHELTTEEV